MNRSALILLVGAWLVAMSTFAFTNPMAPATTPEPATVALAEHVEAPVPRPAPTDVEVLAALTHRMAETDPDHLEWYHVKVKIEADGAYLWCTGRPRDMAWLVTAYKRGVVEVFVYVSDLQRTLGEPDEFVNGFSVWHVSPGYHLAIAGERVSLLTDYGLYRFRLKEANR